jgi:hypothetical protein
MVQLGFTFYLDYAVDYVIEIYNIKEDDYAPRFGAPRNVDVRNWATGVYMYQIELPYQRIEAGKFEIIH